MTHIQRCEMEDCIAPATATVHAQWSILDYVQYESCEWHVGDMRKSLRRRTVDGLPIADLWVDWWQIDQEPLFPPPTP